MSSRKAVIVGKIGDDLRMDYAAQGHTVGLAQRMEQLAPPDGIALSQHTQKPIDGFFAVPSLGPVPIKGAREPVGIFVLEGVDSHRTRLDTSRARGLSRFVGRGGEVEALQAALARSHRAASARACRHCRCAARALPARGSSASNSRC